MSYTNWPSSGSGLLYLHATAGETTRAKHKSQRSRNCGKILTLPPHWSWNLKLDWDSFLRGPRVRAWRGVLDIIYINISFTAASHWCFQQLGDLLVLFVTWIYLCHATGMVQSLTEALTNVSHGLNWWFVRKCAVGPRRLSFGRSVSVIYNAILNACAVYIFGAKAAASYYEVSCYICSAKRDCLLCVFLCSYPSISIVFKWPTGGP